MTTLADLKALPSLDTSTAKAGDKIVFRGVDNFILQYLEGANKFTVGSQYTVVSTITFGIHEVKVAEVPGWHFTNMFVALPDGYTGITDAPVASAADPISAAIGEAQKVVEAIPVVSNLEKADPKIKDVADAVVAAAPSVVAATAAIATAAPALASAATSPVAAIEAAATLAPVVEDAAAKIKDVTDAATKSSKK